MLDWLKKVGIPLFIVLALFIGALLLEIYPDRPVDLPGWLILIFFFGPLYVLIDCFLEWSPGESRRRRREFKRFSIRRTFFDLLKVAILMGVLYVLWHFLGPYFEPHFA